MDFRGHTICRGGVLLRPFFRVLVVFPFMQTRVRDRRSEQSPDPTVCRERIDFREHSPYTAAAVLSATSIISVKDVSRSFAERASPVTRESEIVQIARAFFLQAAAVR